MTQVDARSMAPRRWQRLSEVAAAEFAAGYEQASLNRIIRACGMSKSSFYYYVDSKHQLFDLVFRELADNMLSRVAAPAPEEFAQDFWECLRRFLGRVTVVTMREPLCTDLGRMFYLHDAPKGEGSALREAFAAVERWLHDVLAEGRVSGAVRDDLPADLQADVAVTVVRTFDEWSVRHLADLDAGRAEQLMLTQFDTLRRLLAPCPQPSM